MARLELKLDNVREYGFPFACLLCGSDENPKPRKTTFRAEESGIGYGCAFFMGPLGWAAAAIYFLCKMAGRKHNFSVPICDCCNQARIRLNNRNIAFFLAGVGVFLSPAFYTLGGLSTWAVIGGIVLMLIGAFEHAAYHSQFRFRTLKSEADRVLLDIPNEDYPSLYQRHLDTAVLYGTVEHMGTTESQS